MNRKGFTLIELMVTITIIVLLFTIVFPNINRAKVEANHTFTRTNLNTIAKALEMYLNINTVYPRDINDLYIQDYLKTDYFTGIHRGYKYAGKSFDYSYIVIAEPTNGTQGIKTFTLMTGGLIKVD